MNESPNDTRPLAGILPALLVFALVAGFILLIASLPLVGKGPDALAYDTNGDGLIDAEEALVSAR